MTRTLRMGLVLATFALGPGGALAAPTAAPAPSALIGTWRLDRQASETPARPEGKRRPRGEMGRGGPGGPGGFGGEARARRRMLPDRLEIRAVGNTLSIADSTGAVLEEIVIGNAGPSAPSEDDARVVGTWKESQLEVKRAGPRGGKMTERYSLEDRARTLIIYRKAEFHGREAREWKRVYRRMDG